MKSTIFVNIYFHFRENVSKNTKLCASQKIYFFTKIFTKHFRAMSSWKPDSVQSSVNMMVLYKHCGPVIGWSHNMLVHTAQLT